MSTPKQPNKYTGATLVFNSKPILTNQERKGSRWDRAANTKKWREAFCILARNQKIPKMLWIEVLVQPTQSKGVLQDVGACMPSAKAAIDGIVDAGVLPDDSSEYVRSIKFLKPLRGSDSLSVTFTGVMA
jgi:crossover junction endodeoxyribonuclease RusA